MAHTLCFALFCYQIATARLAFTVRQRTAEFLKAGPENLMTIAKAYFEYLRDVLKQLGEVKSNILANLYFLARSWDLLLFEICYPEVFFAN